MLLKRVSVLLVVLFLTFLSFNYGEPPGGEYQVINDYYIKAVRYSNYPHYIQILHHVKEGDAIFADSMSHRNHFTNLPGYLINTGYLSSFFYDKDNPDDTYISIKGNMDLVVYLAVQAGADINEEIWTPGEKGVSINDFYFPQGVDIYSAGLKKYQALPIPGNRNLVDYGNTYLLFFEKNRPGFLGINFAQSPEAITPEGYLPDYGGEFSIKENGYSYGWQNDRTPARQQSRCLPGESQYTEDEIKHLLNQSCTDIADDNSWRILLPGGYYEVITGTSIPPGTTGYKHSLQINGKKYELAGDDLNPDYFEIKDFLTISRFNNNSIEIKRNESNVRLHFIQIKKIENVVRDILQVTGDWIISDSNRSLVVPEKPRCPELPGNGNSISLFNFDIYQVNEIACSYMELFFMNNHNKDNGTVVRLYATPASRFTENDPYWLVYSTMVRKENFVDEIILTGSYGFCQFDITEFLYRNTGEKVIFAVIPDNGNTDFLSMKYNIDQPKIIVDFVEYDIAISGYIPTDREPFLLQTPSGVEYIIASDFYDLGDYLAVNVEISGYFDPLYTLETGEDKKIQITNLEVIPPGVPALSTDYYNNTGYPVWEWDRPPGASLFRYKLDDGDWAETNAQSFTPEMKVNEGVHNLSLQCKNRLSGWSQPASAGTLVDYTPPILKGITYSTPSQACLPVFSWDFRDNFTPKEDLVYEYRIADSDWISTSDTSLVIESAMAEGEYIFSIKTGDLAGNWSGAFEYRFVIDLTPPQIDEIIFVSPVNTLKPGISWTATDNYSGSGELEFMVAFDESPDWDTTRDYTYKPGDYLSEGPHIFRIQARDKAGNLGEIKKAEILIDVTPPVIKSIYLSIPENSSGGYYYKWEVEDNLSDLPDLLYKYSFEASGDNWSTTKDNFCPVKEDLEGKAHTFRFNAVDMAGNVNERIINTKKGITVSFEEITIIIPELALPEEKYISIEKTELLSNNDLVLPDDIILIEPFYILYPEDLLFNRDFRIEIRYDSFDIPGDEERLQIFYYNTSRSTWQMLKREALDKVNRIITASCNHFSLFALGVPKLNRMEWTAPEINPGQPVNGWLINDENSVLARVKELIAENPGCEVLTVYLRQGDYYCRTESESLYIQNMDFGGCEVIFRAYPGESVRFIGGVNIRRGDFDPVSDSEILNKLPGASRDKVMIVDLKKYGIGEFPGIKRRGRSYDSSSDVYKYRDFPQELYYDSKPMEIARWPNKEIVDYDSHKICSTDDYAAIDRKSDLSFTIEDPDDSEDRPLNWTGSAEGDLWVYYFVNSNMEELIKVDNVEGSTIKLEYPPEYDDIKSGQRFYAFNILEELDYPGEYFIDRGAYNSEDMGLLYAYLPDERDADIYLSNVTTLLKMHNCNNMTFEAIVFEGAKENVIEVYNSNNIKFDRCVIRNCGTTGILISSEYDGEKGKDLYDGDRDEDIDAGINQLWTKNCEVTNSELYNTGEQAIFAEGGNRAYLKSCNHLIENCKIHNFCRVVRTNAGVYIRGDGVQLLHNDIYNGPSIGIYYYGNDHLIKYNKITRLCQEVDDMGAIYSGRKFSYRGNLIVNNLISHIKTRFSDGHGVNAIYLDQGSSTADIAGNILYDTNGSAVFLGGGRDNRIEQNVIAEHGAAVFMNRCAFFNYGEDKWDLEGDLEKFHYDEPPWSTRYPELMTNFRYDELWNRKMPEGNKLCNNVIDNSDQYEYIIDEIDIPPLGNNGFDYIKVGWFDGEFINPLQYDFLHFHFNIFFTNLLLKKSNNMVCNPGFVDAEDDNFSFTEGSVVKDLVLNNKWSQGLWGNIIDKKTFFGCIPRKPAITITGVSEENKIIVFGSAIPWCDIGAIMLYGYNEQGMVVASLDLRPYINVHDNGEFYGEILLTSEFLSCQYCVVRMTILQTGEAGHVLNDILIESNILTFGYEDYDLPLITSFTVHDRSITQDGIDVDISLTGTDNLDITAWIVSPNGDKPLLSDSRWRDEKIETVRLPLKSGDHSLFAWCKDNSGNISRPASVIVTIPPLPVKGTLVFTVPDSYNWRFYDAYPHVKDVKAEVTIIAGGGKGGGGASQVAETETVIIFCPTPLGIMIPCDEEEIVKNPDQKASGGGGGGAGEVVVRNLSEQDSSFNPNTNYTIIVGHGGTNGGHGGCDEHSGGSGAPGEGSRFGDYTARAGKGGEGGDNDEQNEGAGGSGFPPGDPHDAHHGGDGGSNGSGYGSGGDGGDGDTYDDCGDSGHSGKPGYIKIEWYGHL